MHPLVKRISDSKYVKSKYSRPVGYMLFFALCFLIFFYSLFPTESIKKRIEYEVRQYTPLTVEISNVNISPVLTLSLKGLLFSMNGDPALSMEQISISPSIYSALGGEIEFPYKAEIFGGVAKGDVSLDMQNNALKNARIELENIDIGKLVQAINAVSGSRNSNIDIQGSLSGVATYTASPARRGEFSFTSKSIDIKGLKLMSMDLPEFKKVESSLSGAISESNTTIEKLILNGEDFNIKLNGTIPAPWEFKRSKHVDLILSVKSSRTLFNILGSRMTEKPDGSKSARIIGSWPNLRLVPESKSRGPVRKR